MIDRDDRLIAEKYSSRGKLIAEADWPKFGRYPGDDPGDDPGADRDQWASYTNRGTELHIGAYTPERSKEFGQYFYDVLKTRPFSHSPVPNVSDEAIYAHVDNWIADQLSRRNIDPANPPPEWVNVIESIKGLVPAAMMDAREEEATTEMYSEAIPHNLPHPGTVQKSIASSPRLSDKPGVNGAIEYITRAIYKVTVPDSTETRNQLYDEPPTEEEREWLYRLVDSMSMFTLPGKQWGGEEFKQVRDALSNLKFSGKFGNSTRNQVITYIDSIIKDEFSQGSTVGDLEVPELQNIPKDADYSGMEQDMTTNKKFKEFFLEYDADFGTVPTPAADFGKAGAPQAAPTSPVDHTKPGSAPPPATADTISTLKSAKPGDNFNMIQVGDALWPDDSITNRHAIELKLYRPLKIGSIVKDMAFYAKHKDFDTMDKRTGAPQGGGGWDEFIKELERQAGGTWMTDYGDNFEDYRFSDDTPGIMKLGWNPLKWPENYSKEVDKQGMTPEMKWLPQVKVWKVSDDSRAPGTVGMMSTYSTANPMEYWQKKMNTAAGVGDSDADRASDAADRQKNKEYIDAIAKKMAAGKKEWWT